MRREILKFLSDTQEFKPLNEFIKSIRKEENINTIGRVLSEMFTAGLYNSNVIEIQGDYNFLGQEFVDMGEKIGKAYSFSKADKTKVGDLNNCLFKARLLPLGRKELEEYELQQSIKSVNDSVTRTNRMTLIIAGLAALFSFIAFLAPLIKPGSTQVPQLQETNKILQKQGQILDSLLQKQIVYPNLNPIRKDSLDK